MESQHDINTEQEFINNAIIPPPQNTPSIETNTKTTRIVIDSKDRDVNLYPEPNSYEVRFDDDIEDVMNMQLVSIDCPLSSYMINKYFNTFTLIVNNESRDIVLEEGDYTEQELATHITDMLNVASSGFLVTYTSKKDGFIFTGTAPFSISFKNQSIKNSLHSMLGFKHETYISNSSNVITSPYRKNFNFNNYIVMSIDQFDLLKSNSNNLHRTFAVIVKSYYDMNMGDIPQLIKYCTPPIARLSRIKISFKDRYGNPYDFQNIDHRIELLFTSFKQKRKYQNIFLNR